MRHPSPPRRFRQRLLALAVAGVITAGAAFADSGTVLKSTQLRSEPLASANVLAELAPKEAIEITALKGAWAGVKTTAGLEGWVRILNIRTGTSDGKARGGGNALAAVFGTGSTGSAGSTAVKGLDAKILMGASPNEAEAAKLDEFATSPEDARSFARQAPLSSQTVAYIERGKTSNRRQR